MPDPPGTEIIAMTGRLWRDRQGCAKIFAAVLGPPKHGKILARRFGQWHSAAMAERPQMDAWARAKGVDGIEAYWRDKNQTSLDGLPTGIFDPPGPTASS
tara:strand:+ start:6268 stop:6567 length:300 start_codon:yes stop_codon:yes gene_type:complete